MEISIKTWMMIAFVIFMIIGIWKIYAFLPTKQLEDDDRNKESEHELTSLMLHVILKHEGKLTPKELFFAIQEDEGFKSELFWRFNHNRLNQLLQKYYLKNKNVNSIETIYKELN